MKIQVKSELKLSSDQLQISNLFQKLYYIFDAAKTVGGNSGWQPLYFLDDANNLLNAAYIKYHSYGEYIFDWSWANLYQKMGINYYPKLIHAIPFTPINSPSCFITNSIDREILFKAGHEIFRQQNALNSHHWLFTSTEENSILTKMDYFIQHSIQYHWVNQWESFEDFLAQLKQRKRKMIKKERKKVEDYGLKILQKYGSELTSKDILRVYHLYLSTIDKKYSHPYLNETFFQLACDVLQENILFFLAYDEEEIMAMSMFYVGDDTLYGRYWGICPTKAKSYSYLHFEMCYYLGMQYCFEQGLSLFEAGAQGEQKLLRGFSPQVIYSAHQLKHQQLHTEIKRYISENNELIDREIEQLKSYLPFKNNLAF